MTVATYADTSFLFSLFVNDANTPVVLTYLVRHPVPLKLTGLQRCELENAIRLSVFRKSIDPQAADAALKQIERDIVAGNLVEVALTTADIYEEAGRIGASYTSRLGIRTLDLLHVSSAVCLGVKIFLTFDARQHAVAKAVGLNAGP